MLLAGTLWRVVEKLIRAGEDVYAWNSGNWSAMHIAAQEASLESVELLVRLGNVNINQADCAGFRPLHSAAVWKKNPHIVEWLLQNSADAQASSHIGGLPLQGAAFDSAPEVVATMLRNGVNPRTFCEHYHNETVFLAAPLQHAAYSGSIRCIELLLENGAGQYGTVLAAAAYGGNRDMVGALLDAGVPYEEFALEEAAAWKDLITVERHSFIEEIFTRPGEQFCSSILEAAKRGLEVMVCRFIEEGADIEATEHFHLRSPLNWAATNGHLPVVKLLAEAGASVHRVNRLSQSPFIVACIGGHSDVVKYLLSKGAGLLHRDHESRTGFIFG